MSTFENPAGAFCVHEETLTCAISDFFEEYLPFLPDASWVDRASVYLTRANKLQLPAKDDIHFSCGSTAPIEVSSLISAYLGALRDEPCCDVKNERKWNGYGYMDCPDRKMKSDTPIVDFNVDGVISNMLACEAEEKNEALSAEQTAIPMTFQSTSEQAYVNQRNLELAAAQIINDDPRRTFLYGVSVEGTTMTLWYFSRTHSIKSHSFDFTKELETLVRAFLCFLYATEEELGYDASVLRVQYNAEYCYVYKLGTLQYPKYFRTTQVLYHPHASDIASHKCRVWKAVEVNNPANLTPTPGALPVALKDSWVTQESVSEKKIQNLIFDRLSNVEETEFDWTPDGLKQKIKDALACPETYFMRVECDWKEAVTKGKESLKDHNALNILPLESNEDFNVPSKKRDCKGRQRYLVIYSDVGESLALATSLSDAVRAIEDIFIALVLLFLAGWVHRDVSEGNIILVRDEHGIRAKLNDLEYARPFNLEDGVDPRTGTPYFMPLEIHRGRSLCPRPVLNRLDVSVMTSNLDKNPRQSKPASPSLRYNFAHDLESLWWIIVWIVLMRIKGAPFLYQMIFAVLDFPHPDRDDFFMMGDLLHNLLHDLIIDALCDRKAHSFLAIYHLRLYEFYLTGKRQDDTSYQSIYGAIWEAMQIFIQNMSDVTMALGEPNTTVPSYPIYIPRSQELGKRSRSTDNGIADRKTNRDDGSSKKKQKSGGDVFEGIDEEDTVEEDTVYVQDMASIAREDSNPRITIRSNWD
ncbi:hypothetical protein AGABI1DRAFT_126494 [Agaricus bisporus var. burnettii JB137-S8]|uniref:Fungal-type protein kinase domain-containing protein n=1 Tax=Agaricus bisporus var. burnettii (strain JB137-S8 / ATCC MYA-4627 / FGSC 10392) TaxID=597362 RepID=K5Y2P7_AGABU|nr:uncharacterized protein AGABI1DRAFT_126494 [Agaricus bisporus var. burnettii JB137-S8]EKM82150.1 hypothetical protein AGABI1DRAFT_126494 [Agaricus bisporus var. burnettii JB137-S8]